MKVILGTEQALMTNGSQATTNGFAQTTTNGYFKPQCLDIGTIPDKQTLLTFIFVLTNLNVHFSLPSKARVESRYFV